MIAAALLALNIGLASADLSTTMYGVGSRSVREANPALSSLEHHPATFGVVKAAGGGAALTVIWKARKKHPKLAVGLLVAFAAGQAAVVRHNVKSLK